jgi:hypothetical protein
MVASARALLPLLVFLVAWAGLHGSVLTSTVTDTGTLCCCPATGSALIGGDTRSYALLGEVSAGRLTACLRGERGMDAPSRPGITDQAVAGGFPTDGRAPVKYAGLFRGRQKPRYSLTAFGRLVGGVSWIRSGVQLTGSVQWRGSLGHLGSGVRSCC